MTDSERVMGLVVVHAGIFVVIALMYWMRAQWLRHGDRKAAWMLEGVMIIWIGLLCGIWLVKIIAVVIQLFLQVTQGL